jgi:flagellar biosynthesis protein FlhB
MSREFAVFIMMNNHFHDIATAMLMASGVMLWIIYTQLRISEISPVSGFSSGFSSSRGFMLDISKVISKIVFFSLIWISVSAIPRILTFTRIEWPPAVSKNHISGLIAKHIFIYIVIVTGVILWISINRRLKSMYSLHQTIGTRTPGPHAPEPGP